MHWLGPGQSSAVPQRERLVYAFEVALATSVRLRLRGVVFASIEKKWGLPGSSSYSVREGYARGTVPPL